MKSEDDFVCGGKEVTFNKLQEKVKKLQKSRDEKLCGNCKHIIPHRKDKYGFTGNCKEIVIKSGETAIIEQVHLSKEDKACEFFEPKEKENETKV